jgi:HAD superfamily hydrolase (TIGR01509 family)
MMRVKTTAQGCFGRATTRRPGSFDETTSMPSIAAVIFDLDGVLIDSEGLWNEARVEITSEAGGQWRPEAQRAMMGMSSLEWSRYMHEDLGVPIEPEQLSEMVVSRLARLYRERVPLLPGAREAVIGCSEVWPLGLASSSNRPLIELVLDLTELRQCFRATVSSEELPRGKPAPDVYLEAARRLEVAPERCAAVEDSTNGLLSADAAGMTVIAVPNREFPPAEDALARAALVLDATEELTPGRIEELAGPAS